MNTIIKETIDWNLINKRKHVQYLMRCFNWLPEKFSCLDSTRLTAAFYTITSLDLLDSLNEIDSKKENIINWIYSLQLVPDGGPGKYGFRGSPSGGNSKFDFGNLAMTYSALASLIVLNDDLSRIRKDDIIKGMRHLQLNDGSFQGSFGGESDIRFVYCAAAVSYILNDWTGIDIDKAVEFIKNSKCYEGAFGQNPDSEAHGGSTYCAIAALSLMGKLNEVFTNKEINKIKRWCLFKQSSGFSGRSNKENDTCYSFWIGATLKILNSYNLVESKKNFDFILSAQGSITGGFSKLPYSSSDLMHTFLCISGLSLNNESSPILRCVYPQLNISKRALKHLHYLHQYKM